MKTKHSLFWNSIAPIALILNPAVPYDMLLTSQQVDIAKNAIIKRKKKYEPISVNESSKSEQPSFMKKYIEKKILK